MKFSTLIQGLAVPITPKDPEILSVTDDSREVTPGALYIAMPGTKTDGAAYLPQAAEKGAVACLTAPGISVPSGLAQAEADPRHIASKIAARFYAPMPKHIIAVTGTDGKTSVTHFCRQLWEAMGLKAASLGTIGTRGKALPPALAREDAANTTPGPVALARTMQALASHGIQHVAMEASSHGLDQGRLDGLPVLAAAFTNLTRDHLDYHGTVEAYFTAKARLFSELLAPNGTAIVNADDPRAEQLHSMLHGQAYWRFGEKRGAELQLAEYIPHPQGASVTLSLWGEKHHVELPLVGRFQAMNLLAALGLVLATAGQNKRPQALAALPLLEGVPGRLERACITPTGAAVLVDYAHTAAALEKMLTCVREHIPAQSGGRLILVFGCGGDRDTGKRPLMGDAASRLADWVVLTDDNPRSEDPATIRAAVRAGVTGTAALHEIGDRAQAIHAAVTEARRGDLVVIAGKGHEKEQIIGGQRLPFDDVRIAQQAAGVKAA